MEVFRFLKRFLILSFTLFIVFPALALGGPLPNPTNGSQVPNNQILVHVLSRTYGYSQLSELNGWGQTVGVIGVYHDYAEYAKQDLLTAIKELGLAPMHGLTPNDPCTIENGPWPCFEVEFVEPDPRKEPLFAGTCGIYYENATDVQTVHKYAPGANIRLYLAHDASIFDLFYTIKRATEADDLSAISLSFSIDEYYTLNDKFFGQWFLDEYAEVISNSKSLLLASAGNEKGRISFPASHPDVLAVGGTTFMDGLSFKPWDQSVEAAWRHSSSGYSLVFERPAHQNGLHDNPYRAFPDVVAIADGQPVVTTGHWKDLGGTSTATPMWAAVIARANQAREIAGLPKITRPADVYAIAQMEGSVRDITKGTAACGGPECTATVGYDLATGLGAPNVERFVANAAGFTHIEISNIKVTEVTDTKITVEFDTNVPADGIICYANAPERHNVGLPLGSGADRTCFYSGRIGTHHTLTLTNLTGDTKYSVWVGAKSAEYTRHVEVDLITTKPTLTPFGKTKEEAVELEDGRTYYQTLAPNSSHWYFVKLNEGDSVEFKRTKNGDITFYLQDESGKTIDLIGSINKTYSTPGTYYIRVASYSKPVDYSLTAFYTRATNEPEPEPEVPAPLVPHYSPETAIVMENGHTYAYTIEVNDNHYYKLVVRAGDMVVLRRTGTGPNTFYVTNLNNGKFIDVLPTTRTYIFEGDTVLQIRVAGGERYAVDYTLQVEYRRVGDKTEGFVMTIPATDLPANSQPEPSEPVTNEPPVVTEPPITNEPEPPVTNEPPVSANPPVTIAPPVSGRLPVDDKPITTPVDRAIINPINKGTPEIGKPIVTIPVDKPAISVPKDVKVLKNSELHRGTLNNGDKHYFKVVLGNRESVKLNFITISNVKVSVYDTNGNFITDIAPDEKFTRVGEYIFVLSSDRLVNYLFMVTYYK